MDAEMDSDRQRASRPGRGNSSAEYSAMVVAVSESLSILAAILANPRELSPEIVSAWVMVLQDAGLTASDVREITPRVLRNQKFFPTPSEFIEEGEFVFTMRRRAETQALIDGMHAQGKLS